MEREIFLDSENVARVARITSQFYGHFLNIFTASPQSTQRTHFKWVIFLNFTLTSTRKAVYKRAHLRFLWKS